MHRDMKAIQDVQGLSDLGRYLFQVGFPHVAADKTHPWHHPRTQRSQPAPQRPPRPPLAHPQQAPAVRVDLVEDGQEVVGTQAVAPVDLVHTQRLHPLQFAVRQAPLHKPFHRPINRLPTGLKDLGRLSPTQPSPPAGQKAHHHRGQRTLPLVPRQVLDHHPMLGTFHPTRRVEKPRRDPPQRHMPPPPLLQPVIPGRGPLALRASSPNAPVSLQADFNSTLGPFLLAESNVLIDKSRRVLNAVQNRLKLELNGWSPRRRFACVDNHRLTPATETSYRSPASWAEFP